MISVVYKHYEDLVVRAWAISNIQIDEEISSVAKGTLEDLRETTQNRLHELLYKKRNRFVISVQSPVIILPVKGVFQNSPVWIIRMLIRPVLLICVADATVYDHLNRAAV